MAATVEACGRQALDITLVTVPQTGHSQPTLHLASALVRNGHRARICTCDWVDEAFKATAAERGVEVELLACGDAAAWARVVEVEEGGGPIFAVQMDEPMRAPLRAALARRRPDIVVADFSALAAMAVAEEFGLPLVINLPGPMRMMKDMSGCMDGLTHRAFLGLHFAISSSTTFALVRLMNVKAIGDWCRRGERHIHRGALVLVNTFWGLEPAEAIPPNIVVTGPLLPPAAQLASNLASRHRDLNEFLISAGERGAIFVTTGSLAKLVRWQVEALYWGLKKVGCKVVWSLKADTQRFLPEKDDADFYVRAWVPQAELLQHDAIRVVITHCGWGGTLECAIASKPVVAMPFFGDQPVNARLLVDAGMGEPIGKVPRVMGKEDNPYREGDVTAESVRAAVAKVLADDSYKAAAARVARCARASGGADGACRHIESAALHGSAHLLPPNYAQTVGSYAHAGLFALTGLLLGAIGMGVVVKRLRSRA